jgi:hypothetical protein
VSEELPAVFENPQAGDWFAVAGDVFAQSE